MPVRSPSPTINFVFNLTHLLRVANEWADRRYGFTVDLHSVLVVVMGGVALLVVLFKHTRDFAAKKAGAPQENLLLTLTQRLMLGWIMLYAHIFHADELSSLGGVAYVTALVGFAAAAQLLPHSQLISSWGSTWRRWIYLLPADPMQVFWLQLGYFASRWAFPSTTGAANESDPPGGELCAYQDPAVRACVDRSTLCLVYAGLIWPVVEFGRVVVIKCAGLYAPQDDTELHAEPTSSALPPQPAAVPLRKINKKNKNKSSPAVAEPVPPVVTEVDEHDDEAKSAAATSADDPAGVGLFARTLALSNMAAACMFVTWVLNVSTMAYAIEYLVVREEPSCPAPMTQQYDRENALVQQACERQWSALQNFEMHTYAVSGILVTFFTAVPASWPATLRIQVFVLGCMSLWEGTSLLPNCALLATRCCAGL